MDTDEPMALDQHAASSRSSDQLRYSCAYAQNESTSWEVPSTVSQHMPGTPHPYGHGFFHKRCRILEKEWKSDNPTDWIPAAFVSITPYSITLLDALARLAKHTTGLRAEALHAIEVCRQNRVAAVDFKPAEVVTRVSAVPYERSIGENTLGVMLSDVQQACQSAIGERGSRKVQKVAKLLESRSNDKANDDTDRRKVKVEQDIEMQRELWDSDQGVDLVGLEYSDGSTRSASAGLSNWQQLKAHAKVGKKKAKKARRRLRNQSGIARTQDQLLKAVLDAKSARIVGTARPSTMSELVEQLDDDDLSWDDSDSEDDDKTNVLDEAIDREPSRSHLRITKQRVEQRPVNSLTNRVQSKSVMALNEQEEAEKKAARDKVYSAEWLASVHARSQQLPSERNDLRGLGKLLSPAQQAELKDMTDGLCNMMEQSK